MTKPLRRIHLLQLGALVAILLLSGCHGFFTSETSNDSSASTGVPSRFAYVANARPGSIGVVSAYTVNSDGTLAAVAGSPYLSPELELTTEWVTTDSNGNFLYVANGGVTTVLPGTPGSVDVWAINRNDGTLRPVTGSILRSDVQNPTVIAITPSAHFAYVTYANPTGLTSLAGASVAAYAIGSDGTLSAVNQQPQTVSVNPAGATVDPLGRFLYVTNGTAIYVFGINASNGSLNPTSQSGFNPLRRNAPRGVAVEPGGHFAYVAAGSSGVDAFAINSADGTLTPIGNSASANGTAIDVAVHPAGKYVYAVTGNSSGSISAFSVNADGSLAAISPSPVAAGHSPTSITVAPSGLFVYVTNAGDNNVGIYQVGSSGNLNFFRTIPTDQAPRHIVVTK